MRVMVFAVAALGVAGPVVGQDLPLEERQRVFVQSTAAGTELDGRVLHLGPKLT